ncbi:MAG: COG3014 family protein [Marinilabiliaceae bacterium]
MNRYLKVFTALALLAAMAACATFYQKTYQIQSTIANGNFEKADQLLEKDDKWAENNHRVLYYMNRGVVAFMMGNHQESINYFNKADYYIEDYSKKFGWEALSLVSNPMVKPYRPEDFEAIMIHFYKALNFLALDDIEGALVEARRVNIQLQQLNDRYKDHKNKYQRDAFAHNLMGMIYDASGEYNNAFTAYRNAYETYQEDYSELFGLEAPSQLKEDLLLAAKRSGLREQMTHFENNFEMEAPNPPEKDEGELVVFWLNGMGPVKSEWQVTISNFGKSDGMVHLGNREMGMNFSYHTSNLSSREKAAFKDLSVFRVAFPKYEERPPVFSRGKASTHNKTFEFEEAQDINSIAFQSLRDRMMRELGNSLLRIATKKATEEIASNESEGLGTIVSIVNAMTEKADTRNWQSLPYSIYYTRIPLSPGTKNIDLQFSGKRSDSKNIQVEIEAGKTSFFTFHTMKSEAF